MLHKFYHPFTRYKLWLTFAVSLQQKMPPKHNIRPPSLFGSTYLLNITIQETTSCTFSPPLPHYPMFFLFLPLFLPHCHKSIPTTAWLKNFHFSSSALMMNILLYPDNDGKIFSVYCYFSPWLWLATYRGMLLHKIVNTGLEKTSRTIWRLKHCPNTTAFRFIASPITSDSKQCLTLA